MDFETAALYGLTSGVYITHCRAEVRLGGTSNGKHVVPLFFCCTFCLLQDPEVLATKHDPELHHELSSAWQKVQINRLCRMARPPAQP